MSEIDWVNPFSIEDFSNNAKEAIDGHVNLGPLERIYATRKANNRLKEILASQGVKVGAFMPKIGPGIEYALWTEPLSRARLRTHSAILIDMKEIK